MTGASIADDPRVEGLSDSARRLLRRPRPRYRGLLHFWAAIVSVPVGVVLVVGADGNRARLALGVFALGSTLMLATSALVHDRDWPVERVETLVRLDHSTIFLKFATSTTPIAVLALEGSVSRWMLVVVWVGATLGIVAEWIPFHPPPGLVNTLYLGFGWGMLAFSPWMVSALDTTQLVLLFAGGAAYTVGAVVVGSRRPDPWPDVFGYHEIWHVFVVVGVCLHTLMAASLGW